MLHRTRHQRIKLFDEKVSIEFRSIFLFFLLLKTALSLNYKIVLDRIQIPHSFIIKSKLILTFN